MILLGLSGIVVGILNAYDQFTVPALTPVAWNLVIILGPRPRRPGGRTARTPSSTSTPARSCSRRSSSSCCRCRGSAAWTAGCASRSTGVTRRCYRFFVLMLPVTLTLGLINVSTVIGTLFASRLIDPELAPRAIDLAFRLYMLPQGIFSVAVATVLFPTLSRLAARADMAGFARTLDTGIRQIGFLLIPAGLVSAVLAEPITRLVYQRGEFTPDQTPVVAGALAAFAVGLVFNGWMLLLNRAFYGLQSNWIPTSSRSATSPSTSRCSPRSTPSASGACRSRRRSRTSRAPSCSSCSCGGEGRRRARGRRSRRSGGSSSRPSSRRSSRRSSGGASTRRSDAPLLAQIVSLGDGSRRRDGGVPRCVPRRSACASSARCSRCAAVAEGRHGVLRTMRVMASAATGEFVLRPIGCVETSLKHRDEAPKQGFEGAPEAWIVFERNVRRRLARPAGGRRRARADVAARGRSGTCRLVHPRDDLDGPR